MQKVDGHLKDGTKNLFAGSVSRILGHMETMPGCLNWSLDENLRAETCLLLISAATEFETAWNVLRLANIPASRRQGRVASELVALTVLVAIPEDKIRSLPRNLSLVEALRKNPTESLVNLYRPQIRKQGKNVQLIEPAVKGPAFYPTFLRVCRDFLGVPPETVENLREYQQKIQHPSSHASVDVWLDHFEGFTGDKAGARYMPERAKSYAQAGEDLANLTDNLACILDRTARGLEGGHWPN